MSAHKTPGRRSGISPQAMKKLQDLTYLRAQLDLLNGQNHGLTNTVVRYSEAVGQIFATARPLLDLVHEAWPDIGEDGCELGKDMQQAVVAFRRVIYGLLPPQGKKEDETDAYSTGPGEAPETVDAPEDGEAAEVAGSEEEPGGVLGDGGDPAPEVGEAQGDESRSGGEAGEEAGEEAADASPLPSD